MPEASQFSSHLFPSMVVSSNLQAQGPLSCSLVRGQVLMRLLGTPLDPSFSLVRGQDWSSICMICTSFLWSLVRCKGHNCPHEGRMQMRSYKWKFREEFEGAVLERHSAPTAYDSEKDTPADVETEAEARETLHAKAANKIAHWQEQNKGREFKELVLQAYYDMAIFVRQRNGSVGGNNLLKFFASVQPLISPRTQLHRNFFDHDDRGLHLPILWYYK
ncbi:uncharacterized protein LOC122072007 isoform X3 [Macadamia integrifolia]|uniref:uncharacterized protein LOC122072007 isoform X3 n=1 Tax=Macadamia integrifolia TaxID=60698 RepID=UPI001C4E7271|nr:uncharacterized protein LOC122072007 isoform X3 [Macadamia integrifolia]